jgi:hypothetical protein
MYEIVNKGLNNLNGVFSGVTRHNIVTCLGDWGRRSDWYLVLLTTYRS